MNIPYAPYLNWFPRLFDDELLYSALARYRDRCGLPSHFSVTTVLYNKPTSMPIFLAFNDLRTEVIERFGLPWEQLVDEHTMVPIYAKFMPTDKRTAVYAAVKGHHAGSILEQLGIPTKDAHFNARYCPLCAVEDRKAYGEAIWHVTAQYLPACPWHGCLIQNSSMKIPPDSPSLCPAETVITNVEPCEADGDIQEFSRYMYRVMKYREVPSTPIADVFRAFLSYSEYAIGGYGIIANTSKLFYDLETYYRQIPWANSIMLTKLLIGKRCAPIEVCMLGFYLNIPAHILASAPPMTTKEDELKAAVIADYMAGMPFLQIAKKNGVNRGQVKSLVRGMPKHPDDLLR